MQIRVVATSFCGTDSAVGTSTHRYRQGSLPMLGQLNVKVNRPMENPLGIVASHAEKWEVLYNTKNWEKDKDMAVVEDATAGTVYGFNLPASVIVQGQFLLCRMQCR